MLKLMISVATAALMGAVAPALADDVELKVNYGWTSPSELAAVKVVQTALAAKGVKWKDFAVVAHDTGANVSVVNLIAGGTPPEIGRAHV